MSDPIYRLRHERIRWVVPGDLIELRPGRFDRVIASEPSAPDGWIIRTRPDIEIDHELVDTAFSITYRSDLEWVRFLRPDTALAEETPS